MDYGHMVFTNQAATGGLTKNGGCIAGASDRENEELNRKLQRKDTIGNGWLKENSDCYFPGNDIQERELMSENYNDILEIKGIPTNCLLLSENGHGLKTREDIGAIIYAWGRGEISDSQFKSQIQDICTGRRAYLAQCRYTTGRNEKDNKQIIEGIYEYSQKRNVRAMVSLCFEKGKEIADCYGGRDTENWVYYDADYYYQSEHLKKLLQEAVTEMAEEWGTGTIDFDSIEKHSGFTADGGLDFNSVWNWSADMCRGVASLDDFTILPEPGFSFFYQENKHRIVQYGTLEIQAGICIIKYGEAEWKVDVPFNNSCCLGELADYFNVSELFGRKSLVNNTGLLDFLSHFEVFTYFYGRNRWLAKQNES